SSASMKTRQRSKSSAVAARALSSMMRAYFHFRGRFKLGDALLFGQTPPMKNRQWKLIARPVGAVKRCVFEFATTESASPGPGELVVKVHYLSLDPAMRG